MATIIIRIRLHRTGSNSAVQKRNATVLLRKSGRLASQYASEQGDENGDVLYCMEHDEMIVDENYYCEDYN